MGIFASSLSFLNISAYFLLTSSLLALVASSNSAYIFCNFLLASNDTPPCLLLLAALNAVILSLIFCSLLLVALYSLAYAFLASLACILYS